MSVETLADLSEVIGQSNAIPDAAGAVKNKVQEIRAYGQTKNVPQPSLNKMARFSLVIEQWMAENELQILAIQCWTALEKYFGITPCTVMSLMSNKYVASACETDIPGAVSMYALSLASGQPSMLLDWNNNYGDDPDKAVVFHCGNVPGKVLTKKPVIRFSEIFAESVGAENAYGTIAGRIKSGPFTFCRVSTDDTSGSMKAYVGEGRFTSDPLKTFGSFGVVEIPKLQDLLALICNDGFEHHVAATLTLVTGSVYEAMHRYIGWDVYRHTA